MKLKIENLYCRHSAGVWLIEGLSLAAEAGDVLILHGMTAAAGAALADVISGRRRADSGRCTLFTSADTVLQDKDAAGAVRVAEVSGETVLLPYLSLGENLRMIARAAADTGRRAEGRRTPEGSSQSVTADGVMDALGLGQAAYKRPGACSLRELDLARLAAGLLAEPDILVINDLFAHADAAGRDAFLTGALWQCAARDRIVLIVSSGTKKTGVRVLRYTEADIL